MAESSITKRCCTCKQFKSPSEFYKSQRKDGLQGSCRDCQKIYQNQDRQSKKGKATIKRYNQSEKGKAAQKRYHQSEKGRANKKRYQQSEKGKIAIRKDRRKRYYKYPVEEKARDVIRKAVRSGKLPRANTLKCSCGEKARHYHHHKGYEQEHWFDIIPICIKCHKKLHNQG